MKLEFVDDAKRAYRWFSMWAMGVPASVVGVWLLLPERLQEVVLQTVPPKWLAGGLCLVLALGMVGRLVSQEPKDKP